MKPANVYSGCRLDRAGPRRKDDAWIEGLLRDGASRFLALWHGQSLVTTGEHIGPALLDYRDISNFGGERVLLGLDRDRALFAVDLSHLETPCRFAGCEFADLRRVGPLLPSPEASLLAYARGIAYWQQRHRHCGVCGAPTASEEGGHVRRCTACSAQHFPRTDPAVIMLVHDGKRCLLGRKQEWPKGMHSTLAGFVEPGESLEEAVAREVREEVGIEIEEVTYHSSQPWPFPASLMLGFYARAKTRAVTLDPQELEHADWYERRWLLAHEDDDELRLPRRDSIARRLVEDWLRG
ncbi:MAG: NAD(+) diphosphatase [Stellaceae bacterium]